MSINVQRPTRRGFLVASGVLTVASAAAAAGLALEETTSAGAAEPITPPEESPPPDAESQADRYDPQQRFLQLVGGGLGVLYAVQADGKLLWHRHTGWQTNTAEWASGSGRVIGAGWHRYRTVLGGEDGSLFGVRGDGTIIHRRYQLTDAESGAGSWSDEVEVGAGFDRFDRVFGYDGQIYGVSQSGKVSAFEFDKAAKKVQGPVGKGSGFSAVHYGADLNGVVYAYWDNGLSAHRHLGDSRWANSGNGVDIATGLYEIAEFGTMCFAGNGRVYFSGPSDPDAMSNGSLLYHRLSNFATAMTDGNGQWATSSPTAVGTGFTVGDQANLQGYPLVQSIPTGGTISAAISTTFNTVNATLVRLAPSGQGPELIGDAKKITGALQALPTSFVRHGCGWQTSFRADLPAKGPSGVYAVRVIGPGGLTRHLPFVVRPTAPTQPIAVILPVNTYMAYNTWGGHSQYCGCRYLNGGQRTLSFQRPYAYEPTEQGGRYNVNLFADLVLLRWMTVHNLAYDVYTDEDLDRESDLLTSYRAVVLGAHPEYYSDNQRDHLLSYQDAGGNTLYLGGNGIYERVTFTDDRTGLVFRTGSGRRDIFSALGKPSSQLLGTNWNPNNYMTFAPYEVLRDHPLLAGTGLKPGATFGMQGVNGPASGGEVDCRMGLAYEVDEEDIFARGQNPGRGAEMCLRQGPNGGFLFSVGSYSFTGALFTSDALSRIVRNAFDLALGKS